MAYSTINKSSEFYKTKLYSGNNSTNAITGLDFSPNMVMIKKRNSAGGDYLVADTVRGADKDVRTNNNAAEMDNGAIHLNSFDSNGFTVGGTGGHSNASGSTYCSWSWKAGTTSGIATDSETDITPTAYSFNQTSGVSIVKYTGTGTSGEGVPHGLGKKPQFYMVKRLDTTGSWQVFWQPDINTSNATKYLILNSTGIGGTNNNRWNGWQPDTYNFYLGNSTEVNASGGTYVAYVFANITGFSKLGNYKGGTNTFVYTGFKPKFILGRETSASNGYNWHLFTPEILGRFEPSNTTAEYTDYLRVVDWNSNGFRWGTTLNNWDNSDGREYMYMAFGQTMVGSNNVPCAAGSTDG